MVEVYCGQAFILMINVLLSFTPIQSKMYGWKGSIHFVLNLFLYFLYESETKDFFNTFSGILIIL